MTRVIRVQRCSRRHERRAAKRAPRRQAAPAAALADELPLPADTAQTVAELSGVEPDDPDATVAMPWMPVFDVG